MKKRYFVLLFFLGIAFWLATWVLSFGNKTNINDVPSLASLIQDTSTLIIPLEIDLVAFEPFLNKELDKRGSIYSESNVRVGAGYIISYDVRKRGTAQLYPENNKTKLKLPLRIYINLTSGSGAIIPIREQLTTDVDFLAHIDASLQENWEMNTTAETTINIINPPAIKVLGATISFEKQLRTSLKEAMPFINEVIEDQIKSILNTQEIAESVWNLIEQPYRFLEEPMEMWSSLNPIKVEQSPLVPSGPGKLKNQITLTSTYSIVGGENMSTKTRRNIPDASPTQLSKNEKSTISLPILIQLNAFSTYLNDTIKTLETNLPGYKDALMVSNFNASSDQGLLVVDMDFAIGETTGKLKAKGFPYYHKRDEKIAIKELQFSSQSNSKVFDKALNTLSKKTKVFDKLSNKFSYNLKDTKAALTIDLTKMIKSQQFNNYARLNGFVGSINIKEVHCVDDYLVLQTELTGLLKVLIGDYETKY